MDRKRAASTPCVLDDVRLSDVGGDLECERKVRELKAAIIQGEFSTHHRDMRSLQRAKGILFVEGFCRFGIQLSHGKGNDLAIGEIIHRISLHSAEKESQLTGAIQFSIASSPLVLSAVAWEKFD